MKDRTKKLLAVADGKAVPLDSVPDEVFSSKMLGDGFAIEPSTGVFFCPVDGKIESITETRHAYTIRTNDGLDVLVHIGVDTVNLKGKGFTSFVSAGDRINAGELLARADLDLIKSHGLPTITSVLVTNYDILKSYDFTMGDVKGGESPVMRYKG